MLVDVLAPPMVVLVNKLSAVAKPAQLQLAAAAFRASLAAGKVRDAAALAKHLARLAARGEVTPPTQPAGAVAASTAGASPSPWPARAAMTGSWIEHDGGALAVEPGGQSWRKDGGTSVVGGAAALRLWERVDAGELALHAPVQ